MTSRKQKYNDELFKKWCDAAWWHPMTPPDDVAPDHWSTLYADVSKPSDHPAGLPVAERKQGA
jgi:hypothetical protein